MALETLQIMLARARKKFGLPTLTFLEMQVIEWNESFYHKFCDATFSDLSVDLEEEKDNLAELVDFLTNEFLLIECENRTLGETDEKTASVWTFQIDFEEFLISGTAVSRKIVDTPVKNVSFKYFAQHEL